MLFGNSVFALKTFARQTGVGFEYWNELCPKSTTWTIINPTVVGIRRCSNGS